MAYNWHLQQELCGSPGYGTGGLCAVHQGRHRFKPLLPQWLHQAPDQGQGLLGACCHHIQGERVCTCRHYG
eukprot:256453-Lingulodinium_polyedra.AAC.1